MPPTHPAHAYLPDSPSLPTLLARIHLSPRLPFFTPTFHPYCTHTSWAHISLSESSLSPSSPTLFTHTPPTLPAHIYLSEIILPHPHFSPILHPHFLPTHSSLWDSPVHMYLSPRFSCPHLSLSRILLSTPISFQDSPVHTYLQDSPVHTYLSRILLSTPISLWDSPFSPTLFTPTPPTVPTNTHLTPTLLFLTHPA